VRTWHWLHTAPERLEAKPWIVQADYVVAAPSRAAAARSIAFWRHIDERGEWRELRADQVRAIGGQA
jgi:hypothetical protein